MLVARQGSFLKPLLLPFSYLFCIGVCSPYLLVFSMSWLLITRYVALFVVACLCPALFSGMISAYNYCSFERGILLSVHDAMPGITVSMSMFSFEQRCYKCICYFRSHMDVQLCTTFNSQ